MNVGYDESEVVMVLKLGLMCSNNAMSDRPSMRQVVRYLEGEVRVPEDLRAPEEHDGLKGGEEGFDDYVHLSESSSFDKDRSYSFTAKGDVDASSANISTSPLALLYSRGDAR